MRIFEENVARGQLNGQSALLLAYGLYLSNGGTPSGFAEFSQEDIDIMLASRTSYDTFNRVELIKGFAQAFARMFGAAQR